LDERYTERRLENSGGDLFPMLWSQLTHEFKLMKMLAAMQRKQVNSVVAAAETTIDQI